MIGQSKVSVVVPCYNEETGITQVIQRMPKGIDEVIVVDNNCTDHTAEVAKKLGARVVREKTAGYGAAYKRGFHAAHGNIIVTMDGDGTYPPEEIPRLILALNKRSLDFLSACRFPLHDKKAMSITNRFGNWVLTLGAAILFFHFIRDSQSGMWVFKRSVLKQMILHSDGMALSEEIKLEAIKHCHFGEEHIPYGVRIGEVKLQKWHDGWNNLLFLIRKRFGFMNPLKR